MPIQNNRNERNAIETERQGEKEKGKGGKEKIVDDNWNIVKL